MTWLVQYRALMVQDEKQFRVPSAERHIMHTWEARQCKADEHIPGPEQKGHAVR